MEKDELAERKEEEREGRKEGRKGREGRVKGKGRERKREWRKGKKQGPTGERVRDREKLLFLSCSDLWHVREGRRKGEEEAGRVFAEEARPKQCKQRDGQNQTDRRSGTQGTTRGTKWGAFLGVSSKRAREKEKRERRGGLGMMEGWMGTLDFVEMRMKGIWFPSLQQGDHGTWPGD